MRIAFFIRSLDRGGAERQLVELALGLHARGHEVRVFVFYPSGKFAEDLRARGVHVDVIGKRDRFDTISFLIKTVVALRQYRPDIVHSYLGGANIVTGVISLALKPAKIVWGIRALRSRFPSLDWLSRASLSAERSLSGIPNLIISNSQAGADEAIAAGFPKRSVIVIPNGINHEAFYIDVNARTRVRRELGIPEGVTLIGRVGRLDPVKNYEGFLGAAAHLARRASGLHFICIGGGPDEYLNKLKCLAVNLGIKNHVCWIRESNLMRDYYNAMDLLVSTSHSEGFPNVILEGMACGLPCVTTDVGDAALIIGNYGKAVPCGCNSAISDAALSLFDNFPQRPEVRKAVVERFSIATLVENTERNLFNLLSSSVLKVSSPGLVRKQDKDNVCVE